MKKAVFYVTLLLACSSCMNRQGNTQVVNMRCEYLYAPIGIDTSTPRLTWELDNQMETNVEQKAFQIGIASSRQALETGKADVWQSSQIASGRSFWEYDGGKPLVSHTKYYWQVTVWDNKHGKVTSRIDSFEMGKLHLADWKARWITDRQDKEREASPLFRKTFEVKKDVASARAYVTAGGYFELFMNGERVGENFLDPAYTHFDKRILYLTHDVTRLLKKGENALAAVLGNGWYNMQSRAVWDFEKARWRNRPSLLCELRLTYQDGTTDIITSDDTWKTAEGPYTYNCLYSGDKYDARLEAEGWTLAGFNDSAWSEAIITVSPTAVLQAQQMPAIQVVEEIKPTLLRSFDNRIYVFDMGENISGVCKLAVTGERGTHFTLRHGELLKADGRLEQGNINVYYHPVKPGEYFQTDMFTLKGSGQTEEFTPQFTYHGFRYVEVECDRPVVLTADNLTGLLLHTNVEQVGQFRCSNELLNKIWDATNRSYKTNLHGIPTDCPQREKNGWTADAHVAIDLALLNFDGITVYEKWMSDMIDNQREDGVIAGIVPSSGWGYGDWPGPVWDAVLFIIPNALYNYYGDTRSIEQLYPTMMKYLDYLKRMEKDGGLLDFGIGDWLSYHAQTPTDYTSTAFYYLDNRLMARFAKLLGRDATGYEKKAEALKRLLNEKFFHAENATYANGTQTAQALALYLGIVPPDKEQAVADKLYQVVADNGFFLDFGLLGSKTVLPMLSRYGYDEAAYRMATQTEAPSWGYWVKTLGYTTLAETWTLNPEFRDASLNHVFMGSISAWFYNVLAGINYDPQQPGFGHVVISPHFIPDLEWVEASYKSVRGLIKSAWKRDENGSVTLTVTIPVGCTATVLADKEYHIGSGVHSFCL